MSSEGGALRADLGSEHKGGVTGVFQEHSNTSTAPSGGLIRSHRHWLHGDVGRGCRGEGEGEGKKVTVMWDINITEEAGNQLP